MYKTALRFFFPLACFLVVTASAGAEPEYKLPASSSELLLQLKYENVVRYDLLAVSYNKKYYLPLLDIIGRLKIYNEFDYTRKIIKGFLVENDSTFYVDFRTGRGKSLGKEIVLGNDEFLVDLMEVYVVPEVFDKLFGFKADLNYLKLMLNIRSKFDLPIKQAYERFKGYSFLGDGETEAREGFFPLRYDRDRSFLNGGSLLYRVRENRTKDSRDYSFSTNLGLEVLGGDFQVNSSGSYEENELKLTPENIFKWRFNIGDNPFLNFISVGRLQSSGYRASTLPSTSFNGIKFTNETTENPLSFTEIIYEDQIEPGWQVELYKDGFLQEHVETDAQGYYKFVLPIEYGSSNIELRYYGPKGEYEIKKELINIPTQFLQPGTLRYSLNLGEKESNNLKYGEFRLSSGITSWLTNSFSVMKHDSASSYYDLIKSPTLGTLENMDYYNSLSLRLRNDLYTTVNYSHQYFSSVDVRFWPLDLGSYSMKFTMYDQSSERNSSGSKSLLDLRIQLPRSLGLPLNLNLRRTDNGDSKDYSLQSRLFLNIGRLRLTGNYSANAQETGAGMDWNSLTHTMNAGFSYNIGRLPKFMNFINNVGFNLNFNIDLTENSLKSLRFSMSQSLFKSLFVSYNIDKSYGGNNNPVNMSIGLRYELSIAKFKSDTKSFEMKEMSYSNQLEGIIGFNSDMNEILLSNPTFSSNIGYGAANIRVFLDENGNNAYDEGEQLIPGVKVNIPRATINNRSSSDMLQAYNLIPYTQYNVEVDKSSFKNPLWIPKFTEFSFISDPNSYKALDIPCYVGGVLEGMVYKVDTSGRTGQAGVKIHIVNADSSYMQSIPVFSDGSFYYLGVPPGKYTAYVDSIQLRVLNCVSDPTLANFEVKATKDGDFVSGLNFDLIPRDQYDGYIAGQRGRGDNSDNDKLFISDNTDIPQAGSMPTGAKAKRTSSKGNSQPDLAAEPTMPAAIEQDLDMSAEFGYKKAKSIKLSAGIIKYLNRVASYLKAHPKAEVAIKGHSDSFGSPEQIQKISEQRANEARFYLIGHNIPKNRILSQGVGSRYPVGDNSTPDGRKQNRRVEIKIIE